MYFPNGSFIMGLCLHIRQYSNRLLLDLCSDNSNNLCMCRHLSFKEKFILKCILTSLMTSYLLHGRVKNQYFYFDDAIVVQILENVTCNYLMCTCTVMNRIKSILYHFHNIHVTCIFWLDIIPPTFVKCEMGLLFQV